MVALAGFVKRVKAFVVNQFNGATGQSHRHRPKRVLAKPIQRGVEPRVDDLAFNLRVVADFGAGLHELPAVVPAFFCKLISVEKRGK